MNPHKSLQTLTDAGVANAGVARSLALSAIAMTEGMVALNLDYARSALTRRPSFTAFTPQHIDLSQWVSQPGQELRETMATAATYLRSVNELATQGQADAAEAITTRLAEISDTLGTTLDTLGQDWPVGSQAAANAVRSALDNNRLAYDNLVNASRKVAEANATAVNNAVKAMGIAPTAQKPARKAA